MTAPLYAVIRPDGTRIDHEPGNFLEDALWKAREHDERLGRLVKRNRTSNVSGARRAGYTFSEVNGRPDEPDAHSLPVDLRSGSHRVDAPRSLTGAPASVADPD